MKKLFSVEEASIQFKHYIKENHFGKPKAINAKELKQFGNARELRLMVNHLRKTGVPICSGNSGYWYASTTEEIQEITNKLRSHISDLKEVIEGLDYAHFDMATKMEVV